MIYQIIAITLCIAVFLMVEPLINRVGMSCPIVVRVCFCVTAALAAGIALEVSQGYVPRPELILGLSLVALVMVLIRSCSIVRRWSHENIRSRN